MIVEALNQGIDTVQSRATWTLAANLERLVLTGNAALKGTGNALANVLDASQNTAANGLSGLQGNDTYIIGAGDIVVETIAGAAGGVDTVQSRVTHTLSANVENLVLLNVATALNGTGNALSNQLTGNNSNNILSGAAGNDVLRGGLGNDTLVGGAGNDAFVFTTALNASTNRDIVSDFAAAAGNNDVFQLDNAVFTKLGAATGAINAGFFKLSTQVQDANDFIVYNKATGALFYDANGNGAGAGVQFAVLSNKPTLTAADFAVI
jgi:Ca2+-binding RTX toxin-like protein